MKKIVRLNESDLVNIVKRVITEEEMAQEEKVEAAKDAISDILNSSEIEFLKQKFQEDGKEGFKDEVVAAVKDVKGAESGELSEEDMGNMSEDEYKLRSIIHKIIKKGSVLAMAGVVPAMMFVGGPAALGLGIAALLGMTLKDSAFYKRGGYDKFKTGHNYSDQDRAEKEMNMKENYRRNYRRR
jgi:hypothetical protein